MQRNDAMAGPAGRVLWLIFLVGVLHAGAYALRTPVWQAPDEPGHYEAACLLGQLGRPLRADDISAPLQESIIASLARNDFWTQIRETPPAPLPASFAADRFLARSGRQVGDEFPLYYLLPALLCRSPLPIETHVRLVRLYGAMLFGLTGAVAAWGLGATGGVALGRRRLPAVPLVMMLLPMPAFIAGSVNNDALAILTATAVFAAVARIQRIGWSWPRAAGVLILLTLALTAKKTNNFLLPWLIGVAVYAGWRWLRQHARETRLRRRLRAAVLVALAGAVAVLVLPSAAPSGWRGRLQTPSGRRVEAAWTAPGGEQGRWAVLVVDNSRRENGRLFQNVTGQTAESLRGRQVRASALVRSAGAAAQPGRLTVRDAAGYTQAPFLAGPQWQRVELSHTVALTTTYVKLLLAPTASAGPEETGRLLVADVTLQPAPPHLTGVAPAGPEAAVDSNLLHNGDFSRPARWAEAIAAPLENRWQQFAPRWQGGDALNRAALGRYALYAALTFPGFWGNFGWLQRPLPIWIYGVLALICLTAAIGVVRGWQRMPPLPRRLALAWSLAVLLSLLQAFLPMLGRVWQPQGRYLFPALLPITGLLVLGLDAWLDFGRHPGRAQALAALLAAFAGFCILQV